MKIADFKEEYKAIQGLSLENSFGRIASEKDVELDVTIGLRCRRRVWLL
jgi:hypothetical protein